MKIFNRFWLKVLILLSLVIVFIVIVFGIPHCITRYIEYEDAPVTTISFDGKSSELKHTEIVPALDSPIPKGKNVIWCASFLAAWKALQNDIAKGSVELESATDHCNILNTTIDPRPYIPPESLYATAGWVNKGIIQAITDGLRKRFPLKEPPIFPNIAQDSFLAYAYLEANVYFEIPYFQNKEPFIFKDSLGKTTKIKSFGIRKENEFAYYDLRFQSRILFKTYDDQDSFNCDKLEFAIDLCENSTPNQIVVARITPENTLTATIDKIKRNMAKFEKKEDYYKVLGPNDTLLIPDIFWKISHHFKELEGKTAKNKELQGRRMDVAMQDIMFHLCRSGAELMSESAIELLPVPTYFDLNRPFLVYMKKRGESVPYFVMWVDNAELLVPW